MRNLRKNILEKQRCKEGVNPIIHHILWLSVSLFLSRWLLRQSELDLGWFPSAGWEARGTECKVLNREKRRVLCPRWIPKTSLLPSSSFGSWSSRSMKMVVNRKLLETCKRKQPDSVRFKATSSKFFKGTKRESRPARHSRDNVYRYHIFMTLLRRAPSHAKKSVVRENFFQNGFCGEKMRPRHPESIHGWRAHVSWMRRGWRDATATMAAGCGLSAHISHQSVDDK